MKEIFELLIHFFVTLIRLTKRGGVKTVVADTLAMKQQLIVINRSKKRSPKLQSSDRFMFAFLALFLNKNRLHKVAIIFKPATILRFHKALVDRKYQRLYSNKTNRKPGRQSPDQALIDAVIDMKKKNPLFGYLRISMQIHEAFGIDISPYAVGRILRKKCTTSPTGRGPSWLTFIGNMKDSLWFVDLFRCESISLKSHWVMVIIDQFSRRIIEFAVHFGHCDGVAYCRMFNEINSGKALSKYLSSDNDPLFLFHRWKANLRILEIEELKSVPGIPTSHPFVERVIGSVRREHLDHTLFFNKRDLQIKLNSFQEYYNENRVHSALSRKTPKEMAAIPSNNKNTISVNNYQWKPHCGGLYNSSFGVQKQKII